MDMSSCPLAIDEVFNDIDVDELSLLHDPLYRRRSLSPLPTGDVKSTLEFTGYSVIPLCSADILFSGVVLPFVCLIQSSMRF
jgi:hypothetical protein